MDKRKIAYISFFLVIIPTVLLIGYYFLGVGKKDQLAYEGVAVEAQAVRRGSIVRRIAAVGTLVANQSVTIHPELSGKIKRILFEGGSFVEADTPLVEIEDEFYKAQLKEADGILKFAKLQYERAVRLLEKSAGALRDKDKASSELQQAEAKYDLAKLKMDNTIIRAPFEGVVGLNEFSVGALVDERTELLDIVDIDPIKIDFRLPATFLKSISKGQSFQLTVDGFKDEVFEAKIEGIDAKVDPHAHSIAIRASIPNKSGILKPGLFARLKVVVGVKDNVLIVPESSVITTGDDSFVYTVHEITEAGEKRLISMKTPIDTGLSEGGNLEIISGRGVKEGVKIITVGINKVQHGQYIRLVDPTEEIEDTEDTEDSEE